MKPSTEELVDMNVIEGLKELGDGDTDSFFKEIVELYIDQAVGLINEIKELAASGDAEKLGKTAHTLKGASLNVGSKLFAEVCKTIELAGKQNNLAEIGSEVDKLDELHILTIEELKKYY
ncbi:MAG: Hpt domain-containing protein [Ignavibacteriae bacterium]|nr:Hpt domain-containing protein [Ignavibacteriota bacterium]MCB0723323.1 Hpt domain-containing protein [Ignavibacteriota bacterium]MCB9243169.1 Hpt domain-containing protein [Ignavibacteriales bacterium]